VGWLGKAVGGVAGWALGGPLGAILGAAAGHFYDKSTSKSAYRFRCPNCGGVLSASGLGVYTCPHCSFDFELLSCPCCGAGLVLPAGAQSSFVCPHCGGELPDGVCGGVLSHKQMVGALAFFALAGKLAKIDGRVSESEIELVSRFMDSIGMDQESKGVARQIFREAKRAPYDYRDIALHFKREFKNELQVTKILIDFLVSVAHADGVYSEQERMMIEDLVELLELPRGEYESLLAAYNPETEVEKYYKVLGVSPDATDERVKARYRELVRDFHPDALSSKGLAPEFLEFANQRMQEINLAYQKVMESRGR